MLSIVLIDNPLLWTHGLGRMNQMSWLQKDLNDIAEPTVVPGPSCQCVEVLHVFRAHDIAKTAAPIQHHL